MAGTSFNASTACPDECETCRRLLIDGALGMILDTAEVYTVLTNNKLKQETHARAGHLSQHCIRPIPAK